MQLHQAQVEAYRQGKPPPESAIERRCFDLMVRRPRQPEIELPNVSADARLANCLRRSS